MDYLIFSDIKASENWTNWKTVKSGPSFWFENENIDLKFWYSFQDNVVPWFAPSIVVFYWIFTIALQQFMEQRKPITNLKLIMFLHQLAATVFSIGFAYRLIPYFGNVLLNTEGDLLEKLYYCLCVRNGPITSVQFFWVISFNFSKVFHLLDTIFLILEKRNISVFHLFHHSVMVLLPAYTSHYGEPLMVFMALVNVFQHAITYPFLACKSINIKLPKGSKTFILLVELFQMSLGLFCTVYTLHAIKTGKSCVRHPNSIAAFNAVFVSMFLLILFQVVKHFRKRNEKRNAQKLKEK